MHMKWVLMAERRFSAGEKGRPPPAHACLQRIKLTDN